MFVELCLVYAGVAICLRVYCRGYRPGRIVRDVVAKSNTDLPTICTLSNPAFLWA